METIEMILHKLSEGWRPGGAKMEIEITDRGFYFRCGEFTYHAFAFTPGIFIDVYAAYRAWIEKRYSQAGEQS